MLKKNKRRPYLTCWAALAVITLTVLCSAPIHAQISASVQSSREGRGVFRKKGCIQCHSVYGQGGKGGPDLGKEKFYGTYLELAALMWNHFPQMSKRMREKAYRPQVLNDEEMSQLIAYLCFVRYTGDSGSEFRGRKLLKTKGCQSCHKFGGVGGDIGPDICGKKEYLSPLRLVESMWNHGPHLIESFKEHGIKRPEFKGNEIVDIAVAIRSYMSPTRVSPGSHDLGDPVRGKQLIEEKGCMQCHAFRGVGGTLGPDFDKIDFNYSVTQIAGKMWNHGPRMWEIMKREGISLPVFEKGEMADVIAYLYALKLQDPPGNIQRGQKTVNEKGCLSCHSLKGKGAGIAPDLATLGQLDSALAMITAMWNHAPIMQEKLSEKGMKWPKLTGRQMADLYAYLKSL